MMTAAYAGAMSAARAADAIEKQTKALKDELTALRRQMEDQQVGRERKENRRRTVDVWTRELESRGESPIQAQRIAADFLNEGVLCEQVESISRAVLNFTLPDTPREAYLDYRSKVAENAPTWAPQAREPRRSWFDRRKRGQAVPIQQMTSLADLEARIVAARDRSIPSYSLWCHARSLFEMAKGFVSVREQLRFAIESTETYPPALRSIVLDELRPATNWVESIDRELAELLRAAADENADDEDLAQACRARAERLVHGFTLGGDTLTGRSPSELAANARMGDPSSLVDYMWAQLLDGEVEASLVHGYGVYLAYRSVSFDFMSPDLLKAKTGTPQNAMLTWGIACNQAIQGLSELALAALSITERPPAKAVDEFDNSLFILPPLGLIHAAVWLDAQGHKDVGSTLRRRIFGSEYYAEVPATVLIAQQRVPKDTWLGNFFEDAARLLQLHSNPPSAGGVDEARISMPSIDEARKADLEIVRQCIVECDGSPPAQLALNQRISDFLDPVGVVELEMMLEMKVNNGGTLKSRKASLVSVADCVDFLNRMRSEHSTF